MFYINLCCLAEVGLRFLHCILTPPPPTLQSVPFGRKLQCTARSQGWSSCMDDLRFFCTRTCLFIQSLLGIIMNSSIFTLNFGLYVMLHHFPAQPALTIESSFLGACMRLTDPHPCVRFCCIGFLVLFCFLSIFFSLISNALVLCAGLGTGDISYKE